jgi:pimeloyl-ACP methyl ester carboxylesterase
MTMKVPSLAQSLFLLLSLCCVGYAAGFSIQQEHWMYKGHPIGYDQASANNDAGTTSSGEVKTPIVLLNGFGVGSFHQHRLMEQLCRMDRALGGSHVVYGMDYLGQGRSWPHDCQDGFGSNERDLQYSGDMWVDQAIQFIEQVVLQNRQHSASKKVHLVGNSVGGHLAVFVAALRPDLIASITLLNATPVWGLNLPGW